jgi:hypothetical protein
MHTRDKTIKPTSRSLVFSVKASASQNSKDFHGLILGIAVLLPFLSFIVFQSRWDRNSAPWIVKDMNYLQ